MFSNVKIRNRLHLPTILFFAAFTAHICCADEVQVFHVAAGKTGQEETGRSWKSAFTDLQMGIDAAFNAGGGEVWVKTGVYKPEGDGRESTFELRPGVRLFGGFRGTEDKREERNPKANRTILNGDIGAVGNESDNCHHVVTGATDTRIDGFIITRGNANGLNQEGTGGGMAIPEGTRKMIVANCIFKNNRASWQGGGIYGKRIELAVENCTFSANAAANGGGLAITGTSALSVVDSVFSANAARTAGGAINLENEPKAIIRNSRFLFNTSDATGGALSIVSDKDAETELEVSTCTFSANIAYRTGGAVFVKGPFSPLMQQCGFSRNSGFKGTGGIVIEGGAMAVVQECTFTMNRGEKDIDLISDDASAVFDSLEALQAARKPKEEEPEEKPLRMLDDVYVYGPQNKKTKLRGIIAKKAYTILALGDLTDPVFIEHYRNIEAISKDFKPLDVQSFYIYRALAHPENNGYLQPYILQERIRQVQQAKSLLRTKTPWLYDCMDNQVLKALTNDTESNVFIYTAEGGELYHGALDDDASLRNVLTDAAGASPTVTDPNRYSSPRISPKNIAKPDLLDRVRFNPDTEPFSPILVRPKKSKHPFYVKLRAEGNDNLLETGNGRLYLGFHIDPLYSIQWNNSADPLKYTIRTPVGLAAPTTDQAPEIKLQLYDTEPREFVLTTRQLDLSKPLLLRVEYSVYSPQTDKSIKVSQHYAIHIERDPFGGKAYRRQILHYDPPRKNKVSMPAALRHLDANKDGRLSRAELTGNLWSKFPQMDTNKDGYLSANEYRNYLNSR